MKILNENISKHPVPFRNECCTVIYNRFSSVLFETAKKKLHRKDTALIKMGINVIF